MKVAKAMPTEVQVRASWVSSVSGGAIVPADAARNKQFTRNNISKR